MAQPNPKSDYTVRPLTGDDLEDVVRIDGQLSGQRLHGFYERRLAAALKEPKRFIYLGACRGERLAGYVIARILGGEYGKEASIASLDAIGVDPEHQGHGIGRMLMAALDEIMCHKGIRELHSQTTWTNHSLLAFLNSAGFERAPRTILERRVDNTLAS